MDLLLGDDCLEHMAKTLKPAPQVISFNTFRLLGGGLALLAIILALMACLQRRKRQSIARYIPHLPLYQSYQSVDLPETEQICLTPVSGQDARADNHRVTREFLEATFRRLYPEQITTTTASQAVSSSNNSSADSRNT